MYSCFDLRCTICLVAECLNYCTTTQLVSPNTYYMCARACVSVCAYECVCVFVPVCVGVSLGVTM